MANISISHFATSPRFPSATTHKIWTKLVKWDLWKLETRFYFYVINSVLIFRNDDGVFGVVSPVYYKMHVKGHQKQFHINHLQNYWQHPEALNINDDWYANVGVICDNVDEYHQLTHYPLYNALKLERVLIKSIWIILTVI